MLWILVVSSSSRVISIAADSDAVVGRNAFLYLMMNAARPGWRSPSSASGCSLAAVLAECIAKEFAYDATAVAFR